jgi:hypothetical protein
MRPSRDDAPALDRLFRRRPVAVLDELRQALGTDSRTTVFRILSAAGYLTSFNHGGRYYTLRRIPQFDDHGLWFWQDVGFSSHGTLRDTLTWLVQQAPGGHTHEELQSRLRLRVHDTLRSLVRARTIARAAAGEVFLYLSADHAMAAFQQTRRVAEPSAPAPLSLDPAHTIEVLVAIIHSPKAGATEIARGIRDHRFDVTDGQVEEVFRRYDLVKKTARSRSPRSRR